MQQLSNFQVYNASAGSGKTFTLVKEYLKIIISNKSPFVFQQILAITFTNKAAGEMKERVLNNLHTFASKEENDMLFMLEKETGIERSIIFERSEKALDAILQNYASFSITTIDSFTHKLIRTFAYDLQLPMNFEVEMDGDQVLSEAVDMVVSKIGSDKKMTDLLVNYSLQKLEDDKTWDISNELKDFAKILLNENHVEQLHRMSKYSVDDFQKLSKELRKENKTIEDEFVKLGKQGLELIDGEGINHAAFSHSDLPNHFKKLQRFKFLSVDGIKFEGRLFNSIEAEKPFYKATATADVKESIEAVTDECRALYYNSKRVYDEKYSTYILNKYILDSLIPLAVLNYVNGALKEYKQENNILLNAEFNALISSQIKDEPAPFIYERIGEKYRYYFIDEMQDTSQMQWQNLIPLLSNALSSQDEEGNMGSLMLVGDGKQSIYRWRGGKAEQFISLTSNGTSEDSNPFYVSKSVANLETNYRSYSEVIDFNNAFFQYISNYFGNKEFKDLYVEGNKQLTSSKKGGYVEFSFVQFEGDQEEKELVYPTKVFEIIQGLDKDFSRSEICVLVRTKKQGVAIANYLAEQGVDIISSETLLLKNSHKVLFLINALKAIENENDKESRAKICYYLFDAMAVKTDLHSFLNSRIHLESEAFFESFEEIGIQISLSEFHQLTLTQSLEYLIRNFELLSGSDSNVQFFLDAVFEFQQKNDGSISAFLEFWELKKDKLSIVAPEVENAIRIMTIHKAKGLEFPVVIFPYDLNIYKQVSPKVWYKKEGENGTEQDFLINYNKGLQRIDEQGEMLYDERREELELDNFNLLYVALTRAVEQLYLVGEMPKASSKDELTTTSELYKSFLENSSDFSEQNLTYSFGEKERISERTTQSFSSDMQKQFVSTSWADHKIQIVANSSLLWDTEQGDAIDYGNLIHAILAEIKSEKQIDAVLEKFQNSGQVKAGESDEIRSKLLAVVNHPVLNLYYQEDVHVVCEQEIMTNLKEIVIPDRLIFFENEVVIIDYKTGKQDSKYHNQINYYAKTLGELGYKVLKKFLVYIDEEIFVEEV